MVSLQCWTLQKTEKDRLHVIERKVIGKIYRIVFDQNIPE